MYGKQLDPAVGVLALSRKGLAPFGACATYAIAYVVGGGARGDGLGTPSLNLLLKRNAKDNPISDTVGGLSPTPCKGVLGTSQGTRTAVGGGARGGGLGTPSYFGSKSDSRLII